MVKPDLGGKRQCQNCGTKFFDLMRSPIVCPKCGTVFQVAAAPRTVAARVAQSEEEAEPETAAEMVPLEEADAANEKATTAKAPAAADDIEIEDDAADETFLEEEEEDNDDVSDLIDGDIDEDEES